MCLVAFFVLLFCQILLQLLCVRIEVHGLGTLKKAEEQAACHYKSPFILFRTGVCICDFS